MSLWCVQSGRHRRQRLAGAALCALLAVAFFGCGRTAPEGFWEPTKDDTAGIKAVIEANKGYFRTGLAELAMMMCDTALPGTTRMILGDELLGNRFKGRYRLDAMEHVLDSQAFKYTFIAGLNLDSLMRVDSLRNPWETTWVEPGSETTCTVTMAETIFGTLVTHAWKKTTYLYDSQIVISPTETLRLPFYSAVMDSCDTTITKPIAGASFEGCVLKKEDGEWTLWKMAGGGRFYAPGPDDAPYIVRFALKTADNRVDTVNLRPDTTHYGIQRFYSVDDQLLTYSVGDRVTVTSLFTNMGDAFDYLYFNGKRYEFRDTLKFDSLSPGSIYRLSLEHIPAPVLWDVDGDYSATTWGIPIRIQ
ncbi:hypothetical protein FJY68_02515 [candidate division WOR-3 bacterium]|uniref:Uncharacterized protein n=1 Tax=candidate division WOR-3 bacterium TaxID=2052148 RepID=A0A937XEA2_UNCW3|nr:hypothetical protein [candidate division WOR-3 bacterium]